MPNVVLMCSAEAIVPLYNGETAPKAMRGMLLVLYQLQIIIGCVTFTLIARCWYAHILLY